MVQAREGPPPLLVEEGLVNGTFLEWWITGFVGAGGHLVECTTSRSLELIWERGQRFLQVSHREFVVEWRSTRSSEALSELYQEQMEHVPGLRVVVSKLVNYCREEASDSTV